MTRLTANFTLEELTHSDTAARLGVNNVPPEGSVERARLSLLALFLEKARRICGNRPMNIHDAYRSPRVNAAVDGVANSAHMQAFAADFDVAGITPFEAAQLLAAAGERGELEYDQLIYEQTWVHLSRRQDSEDNPPRKMLLTRIAGGGYVSGIVGP